MTVNLKILVCGMPRSMTTWTFNVLRRLMPGSAITTLWIEPGSAEEARFCNTPGLVLGKCHHFSEQLAAADLIVYSYRDLRTAAVSYQRKFGTDCSYGQLHAWLATMQQWTARSQLVLRYETVMAEPLDAIAKLREKLQACSAPVAVDSDSDVLRDVETVFEDRQRPEAEGHDGQTMILPRHRTFQPEPVELQSEDRRLYDFVEANFQDWLRIHGYLEDAPSPLNEHGQELEYRLAAAILRRLPKALVIDVGVEKGSFIDLARRVGARKVVGFEALPRHQQFLADRFAWAEDVDIRPLAVSSTSGVAQFHIALDRHGNELDYHHTLGDLGDSATVVRSARAIQVETVALSDLVARQLLPGQIDFLKIDTDGHDLAVLQGLGDVRPTVVMAEFWDTLPDTSGASPYSLADLFRWARAHGYAHAVTVRRRLQTEVIEFDAPWSVPGDWGNVFFFRQDFPWDDVRPELEGLAARAYEHLCRHVDTLVKDCENKEIVIRRLDAGLQELKRKLGLPTEGISTSSPAGTPSSLLAAKAEPVLDVDTADGDLLLQLEAKEVVIQQQQMALTAYRKTFALLRPFMPLMRVGTSLGALAVPKLGRLRHHPPMELLLPPERLRAPGTDLPTISIVTPSYQQAHFIEQTIRSVLDQGYPKLEYFVQDGGSEDGTLEVLGRYEERLTGWASARDGGQSQAINLGFARTSGEIMAWLNSDDLFLPGSLALVGEFFRKHPEVDVVYGHRILIDERGGEIGRWVLPGHSDDVLSWADFVPQETLFWRRRIWDQIGGIDESFRFAMDWDLLLRFRDAGARMVRLPHFLGAFRVHEAQKTSAAINDIGMQEMARLRLRSLGRNVSSREIRKAVVPYLLKHLGHDLAFRVRRRLVG